MKKKTLKLAVAYSIGASLLLIFLLNLIGKVFVKEVIQEVSTDEESVVSEAVSYKPAPHFELADLYGEKVKLSDFLGSPVVLTFWTTWNAIAADQLKVLDDYLSKNGEALFKIIAINHQEDPSTALNFIERGEYKIRVLLDPHGEMGEPYGIKTLPVTYFLDKEGIIKEVFIGALSEGMLTGKIEKILN